MATGGIVSTQGHTAILPTSFTYKDLIFQIQAIQKQIVEIAAFIDEQEKHDKSVQNQLKSRSFTIVDPYGNSVVNTYKDHEVIEMIMKKFKKDYIPKYIQKWTKIGTKNENDISLLNDNKLKSTVSKYTNGQQFITCGEIFVWIGDYKFSKPRLIILRCFVTDTVEKIKRQLKEERQIANVELKSIIIHKNIQLNNNNWKDGKTLKLDDTIMSAQLYQDNCALMAKYIQEETDDTDSTTIHQIFVKVLTGKTLTLEVNLNMKIETIKEFLQNMEGIPSDQQRIIFAVLRLRGGMYHFTSGRQNFNQLPYDCAESIKNILAFEFPDMNRADRLTSTELQKSILEAQAILSKLYCTIEDYPASDIISDLESSLLPTIVDNEDDNDDISNE